MVLKRIARRVKSARTTVPRRNGRRSFLRDRSGIAAIEFAIILPFLLFFYLGSVELSIGVTTAKNLSRASSIIGDLASQKSVYTPVELSNIVDLGVANLQGYRRSPIVADVVGVQMVTQNGVVTPVARWSLTKSTGATGTSRTMVPGTVVQWVPQTLRKNGAFVVAVRTNMNYEPLAIAPDDFIPVLDGLTINRYSFFAPRFDEEIKCVAC